MLLMKNQPHFNAKFLPGLVRLALVCLIALLMLAACSDQSAATPTPATTPGGILPGVLATAATTTTAPTSTQNTTFRAATTGTVVAPTATPLPPTTVPATPTPVADVQANAALEKIQQAVQKMAVEAKAFRYRLAQTGQLDESGSVSRFEATGEGEFQRPAFHQLLTLKVSGQEQQIELYGNQGQLFQRVTGLVVWRRLQPVVTGPFPVLVQAQNFKNDGTENLDSLKTTRYEYTYPASLVLPGRGQPEGLGALSITNVYQPFTGDTVSPAQATIWVDDTTGRIVRYRVTASFKQSGTTLSYTATYDYSEFDSADVRVEVPGDLPK